MFLEFFFGFSFKKRGIHAAISGVLLAIFIPHNKNSKQQSPLTYFEDKLHPWVAYLSQITEELEQVKQQMDERGTNMTDSGPLVRIKQALAKLHQESMEMDLQIGVLEHSLLQGKIREKLALEIKVNKLKSAKRDL